MGDHQGTRKLAYQGQEEVPGESGDGHVLEPSGLAKLQELFLNSTKALLEPVSSVSLQLCGVPPPAAEDSTAKG